jgi:copper chaperone CopZ
MQQVLRIDGMHCAGCADRVSKALAALAERVTVTLDPPRALLQVASPLPLQAVQAALQKAGDYRAAAVEPADAGGKVNSR